MYLYIAEIKIDDEVEVEWGAGRDEYEAMANIRLRLKDFNDWTLEEAQKYIDFINIWQADHIDGYNIKLEEVEKG